MKKQILTVVMIAASFISLTQVEVTNKFIFSYGMEFNEWNKSYFGSGLLYFNDIDSDNYDIYIEAKRVLSMYGKEFGDYDLDMSESDGEIDPTDVVYEKVPFRSQAKIDRTYLLDDKLKIKVIISETTSYISIEKL